MEVDGETVVCRFQYSGAALALPAVAAAATLAVAVLALSSAAPGRIAGALYGAGAAYTLGAALEVVRRVALCRGRRAVRVLVVRRSGELAVRDAKGAWRHGALRDGSFVAPWLTLVRWRPEAGRFDRTVLILPGMTGAGEFRRLRVLLRWA